MRFLRRLAIFLILVTLTVFVTTFSINVVARSSEVYSYYFNQSQVVYKVYTEKTASEMADNVADLMGLFNNEEFQIYEDNGYDLEELFDEVDAFNMGEIRHFLNKSFIYMLISLALFVLSVFLLYKMDMKKYLAASYSISTAICLIFIYLSYSKGVAFFREKLGLLPLQEDSNLLILLGSGYIDFAKKIYLVLALVLVILISYVIYRMARRRRMFKDRY